MVGGAGSGGAGVLRQVRERSLGASTLVVRAPCLRGIDGIWRPRCSSSGHVVSGACQCRPSSCGVRPRDQGRDVQVCVQLPPLPPSPCPRAQGPVLRGSSLISSVFKHRLAAVMTIEIITFKTQTGDGKYTGSKARKRRRDAVSACDLCEEVKASAVALRCAPRLRTREGTWDDVTLADPQRWPFSEGCSLTDPEYKECMVRSRTGGLFSSNYDRTHLHVFSVSWCVPAPGPAALDPPPVSHDVTLSLPQALPGPVGAREPHLGL